MNVQIDNKPYAHVKNLAFNRRAASVGEINAANYIKDELSNEGIESQIDYFDWFSALGLLIRLGYIIIFFYLIIFRQTLIVVIYFIIKNISKQTRELSFIPVEESKNVIARIPAAKKRDKNPTVIFSAHYDSISAILPYKIQTIFFTFYRVVTFIYIGLILFICGWFVLELFNLVPTFEAFAGLVLGTSLFGLIISVPLIFVAMHDRPTDGSIDNASGVSVLLELAKKVYKSPLKNYDVIFLFTGAEEWGMKGSKAFYKKYKSLLKDQYDLKKSVNINLDMVGSYIGLLEKSGLVGRNKNQELNSIIIDAADELKIPLDVFTKFLGPFSDHKILKRLSRQNAKTFQIACFHSDKDSKYIHSKSDTPDKVSPEALTGCIKICDKSIRKLDLSISE